MRRFWLTKPSPTVQTLAFGWAFQCRPGPNTCDARSQKVSCGPVTVAPAAPAFSAISLCNSTIRRVLASMRMFPRPCPPQLG